MLSKRESADYCGMAIRRFEAICPVAPVTFCDSVEAYDMRDLDNWIDTLKAGVKGDDDADAIVARLD
jgi:hypothetical protein